LGQGESNQSVTSVKPRSASVSAEEGFFGASIDRHIHPAEFNSVERVAGGLLKVDISGDRRDGDHAGFRGAQSHDEGDGIVGGCVSIDEERARHGHRITDTGENVREI
jgi:hypothetical protein